MADSENQDLGSSPSHTSVEAGTSTGDGSSSCQNFSQIPFSDQEVHAASQSLENEPPVSDAGESPHNHIIIHTTETGAQASNGQASESGFGSLDKGKAPARDLDDSSNGTQLNNVETPHASSSSGCHVATPPGITEDLRGLGLGLGLGSPVTSTADPAESRLSHDESGESNAGPRDEHREAPSQEPPPPLTSRQKQKQKAQPEDDDARLGSGSAHPASTSSGLHAGDEAAAEPPAFRPLRPGEPGWEKSSDRPPKKLPIRLKDAVGRQFVFPWEKAKTWEGMERLIRSSFMHVDVIGPYVMDGRYDLMTQIPFEDRDMVSQAPPTQPSGGSPAPTQDTSSAAPATATPSTSTTSAEGGAAAAAPDPPAATGTSNSVPQAPTPPPPPSRAVILPEIWEDIVEPGMSITMHMWPLVSRDWPLDYQPLPPPPPPPLLLGGPPAAGVSPAGWRGRGRGRGGRGMGRGVPMPPRVPPNWMIIEPPKARGKTRKKQGGP
ncbi:hypothetical protein GGR53DRAFT_503156 [Hypoxylon sp. FL1150]|nr:hypothetical protein GGR53DRAFT_503156 [Hypoxylon sp. FL1150]